MMFQKGRVKMPVTSNIHVMTQTCENEIPDSWSYIFTRSLKVDTSVPGCGGVGRWWNLLEDEVCQKEVTSLGVCS